MSKDMAAKQLYIRADGNSEIGMGHVMRCLSIAEAVRRHGGRVHFLMAGDQALEVVRRAGFDVTILQTNYRQMETEIPLLTKILPDACVILADSYFVTPAYMKWLRSKGTLAYMDDVNSFPYPVDVIINGNVYGGEMNYPLYDSHTQVWGGLEYSPLRQEYGLHRGCRQEEYILVTTGSSDPHHLAEKITAELLASDWAEEETICVVCGQFSQSMEALRRMAEGDKRLLLKSSVPDMWNVMNGAKLAITAGGSTMNELACMGVPMIGFSFVDNQERIARIYREKGYSHYGGNYLVQGEEMISEICQATGELARQPELRRAYSRKLMEQVDGQGSDRLAERLLQL